MVVRLLSLHPNTELPRVWRTLKAPSHMAVLQELRERQRSSSATATMGSCRCLNFARSQRFLPATRCGWPRPTCWSRLSRPPTSGTDGKQLVRANLRIEKRTSPCASPNIAGPMERSERVRQGGFTPERAGLLALPRDAGQPLYTPGELVPSRTSGIACEAPGTIVHPHQISPPVVVHNDVAVSVSVQIE